MAGSAAFHHVEELPRHGVHSALQAVGACFRGEWRQVRRGRKCHLVSEQRALVSEILVEHAPRLISHRFVKVFLRRWRVGEEAWGRIGEGTDGRGKVTCLKRNFQGRAQSSFSVMNGRRLSNT